MLLSYPQPTVTNKLESLFQTWNREQGGINQRNLHFRRVNAFQLVVVEHNHYIDVYQTDMTMPSLATRLSLQEELETQLEHCCSEEQEEPYYLPTFWNSIFPTYNFSELLNETERSLIWLGHRKGRSDLSVLKISEIVQNQSSRSEHQRGEKSFLLGSPIERMVQIQEVIDGQNYRLVVMKYYPWSLDSLAKRFVSSSHIRYTQSHKKFIVFAFKAMLKAVQELHEKGYVHRDLKLDNFLVDSEFNVFLNDFELVTKENHIDSSLAGTIDYMAPERLISKKRASQPIKKSMDIWSLGVILYQLFTGTTPYQGRSADQLLEQIYSSNVQNGHIPVEMMKLIQGMLQIRIEKRLTLEQLLSSKIFQCEMSLNTIKEFLGTD